MESEKNLINELAERLIETIFTKRFEFADWRELRSDRNSLSFEAI
jgi:hypothetical protein